MSGPPASPLTPGQRVLDRYVVIERFESGGTSVVYRGEDERLARPVCIKVFNTVKDKAWLYRTSYEHFVQEAFALSRLSHPNTLRIYDFGHLEPIDGEEALPFQVSEFMNGGTLSNVIRREGPMPWAEAQRVVAAICGALDEAHHADIVHRDIKPKNILFGTTGASRQVKLADFGIAKSLGLDAEALRNQAGDTHVVAGRRLLMFSGLWAAPEQLAGHPVSAATDIYSWALVTIFMLTGQSVFSTNEPGEAFKQRHDAAVLIGETLRAGDHPAEVVDLFRRACALDPEDRPASAAGFAEELLAAFERAGPRRGVTASERSPLPRPLPLPPPPRRPSSAPPPSATATAAAPPLTALPGPPGVSPRAPQRLTPGPTPQRLGDRAARFVPLATGAADLAGPAGSRLRVSLVPSTGVDAAVHVRGLNCFVRPSGGRASGATQLEQDGVLEIVATSQRTLGEVAVLYGSPAAGHRVFEVGDELVAVTTADAPGAVALDFGAGADCVFVHYPTAAPPAERTGRWRKR